MITFEEEEVERFCINPEMARQCARYINIRLSMWRHEQGTVYAVDGTAPIWFKVQLIAHNVTAKLFDKAKI